LLKDIKRRIEEMIVEELRVMRPYLMVPGFDTELQIVMAAGTAYNPMYLFSMNHPIVVRSLGFTAC
jgi:hypothetical protein